jgi:hypothetical protein
MVRVQVGSQHRVDIARLHAQGEQIAAQRAPGHSGARCRYCPVSQRDTRPLPASSSLAPKPTGFPILTVAYSG